MRRLVYLTSARQDFRDIFRHVATESGNRAIARIFVDRLEAQCQKLASLAATMGRPRPELRPDIRSFPFKEYVLFFRYRNDDLEIVNVLERHRDIESVFNSKT